MQTMLCPFCMKHVQTDICPFCGNPVNYTGHHTHLPVGFTLQGRSAYVLGAAKGQGGYGITYIALDMASGNRVAIKEYYPSHCCGRTHLLSVESGFGQEETFTKGKEHFILEAQMLQSLSDLPTVVKVLDYFEANNSAYLVMEYLDGLCLKDHVEKNGKLPAQAFLKQMHPLMADMEKMHRRGVVHRDIAPDNIILLLDGRLKLIDFGAARSYVGDKSMTVVVKKGFAPVEQYMRKGSNASTDVYALAATIYYCITGIVPPDSAERQYGETDLLAPTSLGVELSIAQERALEKALEIQPKERTQTVAELAKALAQAPKPVPPKPEKTKPVPKKAKVQKSQPAASPKEEPKKKAKWWIPAAAAAAVLCIGAGVLFAGKDAPSTSAESVQMEAAQTLPPETAPPVVLSPEAVKYNEAVDFFHNGEYGKAAIAFGKLGDYRDAKEISFMIWDAIAERDTISACGTIVGIKSDGTLCAYGKNSYGQCDVKGYTDVIALSAHYNSLAHILKSDHTVTRVEGNGGWKTPDFSKLNDVVSILEVPGGVVGLRPDGSIVSTAEGIQENLYHDCVMLGALGRGSQYALVALKSDGTIIGLDSAKEWTDIVSIKATDTQLFGFKEDGTVLQTKNMYDWAAEFSAEELENVISIASGQGQSHIVALKSDGTVIATGNNTSHQCDVEGWTDIVEICAQDCLSIGLKSDGTVVHAGTTKYGYGMVSKWTDMKLPADRDALLAAIELNYITE